MTRKARRAFFIATATVLACTVGLVAAHAVMLVSAFSSKQTMTVGSVPSVVATGSPKCANPSGGAVVYGQDFVFTWVRPDIPPGVVLDSYTIVMQTTKTSVNGLITSSYDFADKDWSPAGKWGAASSSMKAINADGSPYTSGTGSSSGAIPYLRAPNAADGSTITYRPPVGIEGSATTPESSSCASAPAGCTYNVRWGADITNLNASTRTLAGTMTVRANYTFGPDSITWSSDPIYVDWSITFATVLGTGSAISCGVRTS